MRSVKMLVILVLVAGLVGNASASLVAHYELATNFNDSSGNGLHGTPMNGASILSDLERGNVLSLNGAGQYVDCGNDTLFNITNAITVACWIKVNAFDVEWQSVVAKGNSAWRMSRDGTQNDLEFACTGLSGNWKVLGSINVNDGKWHHVAGVYNGSEISLYVDGIIDDSLAASGTIDTTTHKVWLGGNVERLGREWNGLLDDVRIYDHALSAAEIAGLAGKMGTGYTYQGRLLNSNNPSDGSYDFEFKLYSDPGIGIQKGNTIDINDLDVIDGYFTVELDFGSDVFSGDGLWLDISVRPGDSTGGFTTLSPRQAITPVPYALQSRGIFVDDVGNVGIGTTSPGSKLDVQGGSSTAVYAQSSGSNAISAASSAGGGFAAVFADATAPNTYGIWSISDYIGGRFESNSGTALEASTTSGYAATFMGGNVGIGTTSPYTELHIASSDPTTAIKLENLQTASSWNILSDYEGDFLITEVVGSGPVNRLLIKDGGDISLAATEGKVGIGTTNPEEMLHIDKTSAGNVGLRVSSDAASYQYMNFGAENGYSIGRASDDKFFLNRDEPIGTGVLRVLTVQSNGTVGIGTKNPTGRLHVETSTTNEFAVHGKSGTGAGVYGETAGLLYAGVQGKTTNANNSAVFGENTATSTRGSLGGPDWGVSGNSSGGHGVQGQSVSGAGVYGETAGLLYAGVHGKTTNANNAGAFGENTATNTRGTLGGPTWGVKGSSAAGRGVDGSSTTGYGVHGESSTGYAGYFEGNVWVTGNMSAETVVDRTPYPKDVATAYQAVMSMERLPEGQYEELNKQHQLDHSRLDDFIRSKDGNRDLSATVSCLNEVVKDLVQRLEKKEESIRKFQKTHVYIEQLHKQNKALEARLVKLESMIARPAGR